MKPLRTGIWLYFILLILEGALRKWILPELSTPLLVVRDPLALWLLFRAWQTNVLPTNGYVLTMGAAGILSFAATVLVGHGDMIVATYGLRILCLHFPLMFLIGRVFSHEDVIKLGRLVLFISIPMIFIISLQFYSVQSAWINEGVGGTGSAGFGGALGYYRPPGTFSFTNGNALFWGMTAPFILYFWLIPKQINRLILVAATAALILAIPLSISRGLFLQVCITVFFALLILFRKPNYLPRIVVATAGILLLIVFFSDADFVKKSVEVFTARFTSANEAEGGLVEGTIMDRFLGELFEPIKNSGEVPLSGRGLGMGTQVGAKLISGETGFLITEGEWGRIIGEMGLLLGLLVIVVRLMVVIKMGIYSFRNIKYNNILSWLLFSFGGITILVGQWGHPTTLGFSTLIGGLILSAIKREQICPVGMQCAKDQVG